MYVVDTDVLSMINPTSKFSTQEAQDWRQWVKRNEHGLYISVATVMEVRMGIEKSKAKGATNKARQLEQWLAALETTHKDHVIPISIEIAHKAGEMLYAAIAKGSMPSTEDALVAATAAVKGFRVLSRNAIHMVALGADWANPLEVAIPDTPHPEP